MYEGIVEDKQRRTLLAMITAMDDAAKVGTIRYTDTMSHCYSVTLAQCYTVTV